MTSYRPKSQKYYTSIYYRMKCDPSLISMHSLLADRPFFRIRPIIIFEFESHGVDFISLQRKKNEWNEY